MEFSRPSRQPPPSQVALLILPMATGHSPGHGHGGSKAVGVGTRTRASRVRLLPHAAHLRPRADSAERRGGRGHASPGFPGCPAPGLGAPRSGRRSRGGGERSSSCGRRVRPPAHPSASFSGSDFPQRSGSTSSGCLLRKKPLTLVFNWISRLSYDRSYSRPKDPAPAHCRIARSSSGVFAGISPYPALTRLGQFRIVCLRTFCQRKKVLPINSIPHPLLSNKT